MREMYYQTIALGQTNLILTKAIKTKMSAAVNLESETGFSLLLCCLGQLSCFQDPGQERSALLVLKNTNKRKNERMHNKTKNLCLADGTFRLNNAYIKVMFRAGWAAVLPWSEVINQEREIG